MEELTLTGAWWVPDRQDSNVAGTLRFSHEDGVRLELIGSFKELASIGTTQRYPVIFGAGEGKAVTLQDCIEAGSRFSSPGIFTQELIARAAYIGRHIEPGGLRFREALIRYSYLDDWINVSGFELTSTRDEAGQRQFHVAFSYPDEIVATTPLGSIVVTSSFRQSGGRQKVEMTQDLSLRVEANEGLTLQDWQKRFIQPLQNFFTLATGKPNALLYLGFYEPRVDPKAPRERPSVVKYSLAYPGSKAGRRPLAPEMLFTLEDVRSEFGTVLSRWITVADELDSVCGLFFSTLYSPSMYLEQQFLNVVQAAESYHRRRFSNQVLSKEQHSARMQSVLNSVPSEHKSWLKEKLRYANEPSLRQRLRELLDVTAAVMDPLVPDRKRFIQKVLDTRNYRVHYDTSLRRKAIEAGAELYSLTMVVSFLVQACFLRELGIEPERWVELFNRNQQYLFAASEAKRSV